MPTVVEVPGLGEVEFPDGMSKADMSAAVRKTLAHRTTQTLAQKYPQYFGPDAKPAGGDVDVSVGGFFQGAIGDTIKGLWDSAARVLSKPNSPRDWAAFAVAGPLGPLVADMAEAQVATSQKAVDAAKDGRYAEAAGYGVLSGVPVLGPALAGSAETIGSGEVSRGVGQVVANLAGSRLPSSVSKVKSVRVTPKVLKATLPAEDAAAVAYGKSQGVRMDAATETGSNVARRTQKHVQDSFGGSRYAQEFRTGQKADLEALGGRLADEAAPGASMSAETAAGKVSGGLKDRISERNAEANRQYKTLRDIEQDPANLETVQNGLDEQGKPAYEELPLPVDTRAMKAALKPIEQEWMRVLTPGEQRVHKGLLWVRNILNDKDFVPASAAEKNLGGLKAALRKERGVDGAAVSAEQNMLTRAMREYDKAITAKVSQARRSGQPTVQAPAPAVTAPSPAAGTPAAAAGPVPGLAGVVGSGETKIRVPGESRKYNARYEVRELSDVQASHSGQTFQPNRNYELVNDRDYTRIDNQRKVVEHAGDKFEPAELVNDSPSALGGPAVIDSRNNALGGNGRLMTLERVYAGNPRAAAAYVAELEGKAAQFGIDPAQVRGMKQPVLVRVVDDADLPDTGAKQRAITDFNRKDTAEMRPAERAIADSRRVSPATLDDLAGRLDKLGDDATLAQALDGRAGGEVLNKLIDDGVIAPGERAALAEGDILTKAGRARISDLMLGRFFSEPAQLDAAPLSVRGKLERMAAPLAKLAGTEFDLTDTVRGAVDLIEEARIHGTPNLDDFVRQGGLFLDQKYGPEVRQLARHLQSTGPNKLVAATRAYAEAGTYGAGGSLFGDAPTAASAFASAFGGDVPAAAASPVVQTALQPAAAAPAAGPAAPAPRMLIQSNPAGAEATGALKAARLSSALEWRADRTLKQFAGLKDEPVLAYERLVKDQDRSVGLIRQIEREAPQQVQYVARAFVEGMLEKLKQGDWANGKTIESLWNNLGPETKKVLFKNPALRENLDNFVRLVRKTGENPNPSGSGPQLNMSNTVMTFASGVGAVVTTGGLGGLGVPAAYAITNAGLARLLFSPKGTQALMNGLRVPLGNKAAAAMAAGQILKLAGQEAKALPQQPAAAGRTQSNERQAVAVGR